MNRMRVLMVGASVVGSYFGAKLIEAGSDVTFLERGHRAWQLERQGIRVRSPLTSDLQLRVSVVKEAAYAPPPDFVFLACRAFDVEGALDAAIPAMHPHTVVVPLVDGLDHYRILAARLGGMGRFLGGACRFVGRLDESGLVNHLEGAPALIVGLFACQRASRSLNVACRRLLLACEPATFSTEGEDPIERCLWRHWVHLATLTAATTLVGGTIRDVLSTPFGALLVQDVLKETLAIAHAYGNDVDDDDLLKLKAELLDPSSPARPTLARDMEAGRPIERHAIIGDLIERARACGIATPILCAVDCRLTAYESRRSSRARLAPRDAPTFEATGVTEATLVQARASA